MGKIIQKGKYLTLEEENDHFPSQETKRSRGESETGSR
jgi:hypothetical protein